MQIAIACCGLGRIRRGVEAWATDLAEGLAGQGVDVRLFGSGAMETPVDYTQVWSLPRDAWWNGAVGKRLGYLAEQSSFMRGLTRRLKAAPCDIVHVGDPQIGWWLRQHFRKHGPAVFFKDGLLLGADWLWRFDHVQVLAPYYRSEALETGRDAAAWHVIPHFVDTDCFRPDGPGIDIPKPRGPVLLAVGDLALGSHKRLDHVIESVARITTEPRPHLWIAGQAMEADRRRIEALGKARLGDRFRLFANLPRSKMPELYRSADVFVHAALREPFGIVFLEALASGLPILAHDFPVTAWIVGDAGVVADLASAEALTAALTAFLAGPDRWAGLRLAARRRAEQQFSRSRVVPLYLEAYRQILLQPRPGRA